MPEQPTKAESATSLRMRRRTANGYVRCLAHIFQSTRQIDRVAHATELHLPKEGHGLGKNVLPCSSCRLKSDCCWGLLNDLVRSQSSRCKTVSYNRSVSLRDSRLGWSYGLPHRIFGWGSWEFDPNPRLNDTGTGKSVVRGC